MINAVLPGPTASEGVTEFVGRLADAPDQPPADFEKELPRSARGTSLLQRFATVDEIADAVAFIRSPPPPTAPPPASCWRDEALRRSTPAVACPRRGLPR